MQVPISEKIVAQIWHHQLISNPVTDSGVKLQVIYPGRPNNSNGCDFKDAVLIINGKIIRGDVEIHVKSSQWYKHSHHLNPKYNNTVLHVAMWNDNTSHVILQSGEAVPTVCLDKFLRAPSHTLRQQIEKASYITLFCPYLDKRRAINSTSSLLKTTGKKRFTIKATLFKEALRNNEDAGQILFRSITRALGYSQNMQPRENLANNLPLSLLEQVELNIHTAKQAWILGTAGLLPSQRHKLQNNIIIDGEIRKLENIWKASGLTAAIKEADWCFSKVRPDNFPTRRLVALSYILSRYAKSGLLHGILDLVRHMPQGAGKSWLERGFTITESSYWANRLDFGIVNKRTSALLGQRKAAEIVVNVVLPFAYAWGQMTGEATLKERAIDIYHHHSRMEDNELTRYMKQQLRIRQDCNISACQQQGLIHIFKNNCRHKNCSTCPVALSQN